MPARPIMVASPAAQRANAQSARMVMLLDCGAVVKDAGAHC
jgi:hypothetical protein